MGKAFVAGLAKNGARDPEALAAWIGRKKHGNTAFRKLSSQGKKKNSSDSSKKADAKSSGPQSIDLNGPAPKLTEADLTSEEKRRLNPGIGFTPDTLEGIAESRLSRARIKHLQAAPPSTEPANEWEAAMVKAGAKNRELGGAEQARRVLEAAKDPKSRLDVLHGRAAEIALKNLEVKARRAAARKARK